MNSTTRHCALLAGAVAAAAAAGFLMARPKQPASQQTEAERDWENAQRVLALGESILAEARAIRAGEIEPGADWAMEWAGSYRCGDGLGVNISIEIAPRGGMAYTWRGCLGLYEYNSGQIVEGDADGLLVKLQSPSSESGFHFISERLYFVRWGDHRFLVPHGKAMEIIAAANDGSDARSLLCRMPCADGPLDPRAVPAAPPVLPPQLHTLLRFEPLALNVVDVKPLGAAAGPFEGDSTERFEVSFDKGAADALYAGLDVTWPWSKRGRLTFTAVTDHTARATVKLHTPIPAGPIVAPAVGDTLSIPGAAARFLEP